MCRRITNIQSHPGPVRGASTKRAGPGDVQSSRAMAWSMLPMLMAMAGVWIDEQSRLGFTNWRAACQAAGLSPRSLLVFTLELLPTAVIGALAGGLLVLAQGMLAQHRGRAFQSAIAAHAGCSIGMAAGVVLCALALAWPLAVAVEALLAAATAAWIHTSVFARTGAPASA